MGGPRGNIRDAGRTGAVEAPQLDAGPHLKRAEIERVVVNGEVCRTRPQSPGLMFVTRTIVDPSYRYNSRPPTVPLLRLSCAAKYR